MIALAAASPDRNLHVVDLPYRLCSWALDDPDNVALWVDGRGLLAGWAVLQAPFWTVDLALRPSAETDLFPRILDWMAARTRAAVGTPHGHPTWYVHVFGDQASRLRRLDQAGFACQSDVGENSWSRVLLERRKPLPRTPSHSGFNVRPLRGAAEVQAYVELHRATFGSKNMTAEWRTRTVTAPHHVEDSDLVAVDADGRFAGFCIGWLCRGDTPVGQIEPLGIASAYRERGLGAALLSECVRRLAAHGARTVLVETDTYRTPALGLYESLGFEALRDVLVYRKESANGAADDPEA
jgi:ribosomal protein S18 acetylase RimI-like enzyme